MLNRNTVPGLSVLAFCALGAIGCGGGDGSLGDSPTLTGQIDSYALGSGYSIQALVIVTTPPALMVLASAPIDAAGNFSLTLPGSATVTPDLLMQHYDPAQTSTGCMSSISISPTDFGIASIAFRAIMGTMMKSVTRTNGGAGTPASPLTAVSYSFLDRQLTESGTVTCPAGTQATNAETINASIQYQPGWNQTILTTSGDTSQRTISESTGAQPDGLKWIAQ